MNIRVAKSVLVGIVVASVAVPIHQFTHSLSWEIFAGVAVWGLVTTLLAIKSLELNPTESARVSH